MASTQFEQQMSAIVPRNQSRSQPFSQDDISGIKVLLEGVNRPSWAARPKIYAMLRLLGCLDLMQGFVVEGIEDSHFPFTEDSLPIGLKEDESLRDGFLRKQKLVPFEEKPNPNSEPKQVPEIVVSNEVGEEREESRIITDDDMAQHFYMPPPLEASSLQEGRVDSSSFGSDRRPASTRSMGSAHSDLIVDDHGSTANLIGGSDKIFRQDSRHEKIVSRTDTVVPGVHTESRPGNLPQVVDSGATGKILQRSDDNNMKFPGQLRFPVTPQPNHSTDKMALKYPDKSNVPIPVQSLEDLGSYMVRKLSSPAIPEPSINLASRFLGRSDDFLEAAKDGNVAKIGHALSRNANLIHNTESKDSWKAIHFAAAQGYMYVLSHLIPFYRSVKFGLEFRTKSKDRTALFLAAQGGHAHCVRLLCDAGANTRFASKTDGASPLHAAAQSGSEATVGNLLQGGAFVNQLDTEGMGPLFWSIRTGQPRVVTMLVQAGAELERRATHSRLTPLLSAVASRDVEMTRHLIYLGANVNADGPFQMTALHKACLSGDLPMVVMLVSEARANILIPNAEGFTPLHCAARYGSRQICQYLLQCGANPAVTNLKGLTAAEVAHYHNKHGVI